MWDTFNDVQAAIEEVETSSDDATRLNKERRYFEEM